MNQPPPPDQQATDHTPASHERKLKSTDLLLGRKEVLIEHHGEVYRLRETRNGKLILGK